MRGTGAETRASARFNALMHDWWALPAPCGLLGSRARTRTEQISHRHCPWTSFALPSVTIGKSAPAAAHATHNNASNEHGLVLGHAGTRLQPCCLPADPFAAAAATEAIAMAASREDRSCIAQSLSGIGSCMMRYMAGCVSAACVCGRMVEQARVAAVWATGSQFRVRASHEE